MVNRFDIFMLNMDDGPNARDTRPCIVVSPDEMNAHLETVIIAPVSSVVRAYPTRIMFDFLGNRRAVVLDQLLTVDKSRLTKKIGELDAADRVATVEVLHELFAA